MVHGYIDDIMERLMAGLGLEIPEYNPNVFLSRVTLFSKRKNESGGRETKYGTIDPDQSDCDIKRAKIEKVDVDINIKPDFNVSSD